MHTRSLCLALPLWMCCAGLLPGQQKLRKELEPAWNKWTREDVAYIITDEELRAFRQLGNDDEREQFVEQFWLRRDPTPETAENEYKEEHYRRFAYANQHYASGIPGWKTDRGRMYIRFGPPDEIEGHPSGGSYQRPAEQGGGSTSTYPFEIWRYRHLDGVGDDIQIQFVDQTMTGEYRLTTDPCANDALRNVPNAGLTLPEQAGLSTKLARFQNTDGSTCGAPFGGKPASSNEFERLRIQSEMERAPAVKFRDLEALVNSRVSFNVLPMQSQVDYLRVTDASVLTNVTVQIENRDLGFVTKDGVAKGNVNLFGRVTTLARRPVTTFEKPLEVVTAAGQVASGRLVFQQSVPLAPGRYRLDLVAKDVVSGNLATAEIALDVPRFVEEKPSASGLILADLIEPLPMRNTGGGMFAVGDLKVRPRVNARFAAGEKMGIYLQVYKAGVEGGSVSFQIDEAEEFSEALNATVVAKMLPLRDLQPGAHRLRVRVRVGGEVLERAAGFEVLP